MTSETIRDVLRDKWQKLDAVPPGWNCDDALAYLLLAAYEDAEHADDLLAVLRHARDELNAAVLAVEGAAS